MARSPRNADQEFTIAVPSPVPIRREREQWSVQAGSQQVRLSNLKKIWWPNEGFTKGDVINYYWNVAPYILPHLLHRPLTMKRMPDGIDGDFFYEKERPASAPAWVPVCSVHGDEGKVINYVTAPDVAALLFVANLGAIEMHPLHSRCATPSLPDYLFFDLDPFDPATFDDVRAVARHVKAALDALGLPSYPKISGATGMQIFVPLMPGPTYQQTRDFVGAIGRMILRADPDRVTMEWQIAKRPGKIFIDHNMNREGANIAAVYSVRPESGGTVSMPVTWEEVEAGVHPSQFTMITAHARLAERGDLFRGVGDAPVDLRPAMQAIGMEADFDLQSQAYAEVDPDSDPEADSDPDSGAQAQVPRPRVTLEGGTPKDRRLDEYIRKRDLEATPEPGPGQASVAAGETVPEGHQIFVIHKHNATRLHYDLRLEYEGALESWAVPRGLPLIPGEKRLAVQTEPHPMEYADFEGWIPQGHYGAGESLIFDRGTYETLEWEPGKATVRLHGQRHRGEFHMVRTQQNWLIFLSRASASLQPPPMPSPTPMLADSHPDAFDDDGWTFEPKLDGVRTIAIIGTDGTRLVSRTGRDQTAIYPELSNLAMYVNAVQAIIDGEIVATDEQHRPSFERLQGRMNLSAPRDIDRARKKIPVTLYAFDVLWFDGTDVTNEPIEVRRALLERIVTPSDAIRVTMSVPGNGTKLFAAAKALGFEGIVGKRAGSKYLPGRRSKDWRKIKAVKRMDCVILGWTPGEGSRAGSFGSLMLGAYQGASLVWVGQVGTGFTEQAIERLLATLAPLETAQIPVDDPQLRKTPGLRWVRPELVCDVEYLQITQGGKLRAPSYKGLRSDKEPSDCVLDEP